MSRLGSTLISPFDKPELVLSMALDGELTGRGLWDALADPAALSMAERDGIAARIKRSLGDRPLTNALTDIALNPFAWFFFVTSPAGASAIGAGARGMFNVAKAYSAFVNENKGLLQTFKLSTGLQNLRGGASPAGMVQIEKKVRDLARAEAETYGREYLKLVEGMAVKHLDWQSMSHPARRELVADLNTLLVARAEQWHKPVTRFEYFVRKGSKVPGSKAGPTDTVKWEKVGELTKGKTKHTIWERAMTRSARAKIDPEVKLREMFGADGVAFAKKIDEFMEDRKVDVFGLADEKIQQRLLAGNLTREEADLLVQGRDRQLYKMWRLAQNPAAAGQLGKTTEGYNMLRSLMGPMLELTRTGDLPFEEWKRIALKVSRGPVEGGGYWPHNVGEIWRGGKQVTREHFRELYSLVKPSGAINRAVRQQAVYHPEDLARAERLLGRTRGSAWDRRVVAKRMARADGGETTRFLRMNVQKGLSRYAGDTARVLAFTEKPGAALLAANEKAARVYQNTEKSGASGLFDSPFGSKDGASMRVPVNRLVESGYEPPGGFSVIDLIQADAAHLQNRYAAEQLVKIYLPRAAGASPMIEQSAYHEIFNRGKQFMEGFVETSLGKALEKSGGYAGRLVTRMRLWAEQPIVPGEVGKASSWVAKRLYGTHLGFNPFSIIINATQTFGIAANSVGWNNMFKGYKDALEDLGAYAAIRRADVAAGKIRLTPDEYNQRIRDSFRIVHAGDIADDDVAGLMVKEFELLDSQLTQSQTVLGRRKNLYEEVEDFGLAAFQKMEWFNRLSSGYGYLHWAKSAGLVTEEALSGALRRGKSLGRTRSPGPIPAPLPASVVEEARQFVAETQFGSSVLNTPDIMQPGSMLGNPLARQFLSFILRSFTAPFAVGPQIAEGVRQTRWGAEFPTSVAGIPTSPFIDFARLTGVSAVMYEAGKNLFGVDALEFTPYAATTEALPFSRGGRYDEGVLPLPPIVDIPLQAAKGLLTEDVELLKRQFSRVMPAGAGARRLTPVLQSIFHPVPGVDAAAQGLAKVMGGTFVDYGARSADGKVPLYRGDGSLIGYQSPMAVVLRGLGVPVQEETEGELAHMVVKNVEEMQGYKRRYIDRLFEGDVTGAEGVKAEFGKRFKTPEGVPLPLVVSRAQLKSRWQLKTVGRVTRIIDRAPPEVREQFRGLAEEAGMGQGGGGEMPEGFGGGGVLPMQGKPQPPEKSGRIGEIGSTPEESPFGGYGAYGGFGRR